jgi:hypothetical protein
MILQHTATTRILEAYLYRGIIEFKKGYRPESTLIKDKNRDLHADFHNILN